MDIKLTFYRYYQVIDRGNKSIRLSLSILTIWVAVFFLFLKINSMSINNIAYSHFEFDWNSFAFWGVISFFMLGGAFCYGFGATDTEHKGDRDLMNEYLITANEKYSLTFKTVRELNKITSHKERRVFKATVLNLIACIFAFSSFVFGFFSVSEILNNLKVETFLFGVFISFVILVIFHFSDGLKKIFPVKKRNRT